MSRQTSRSEAESKSSSQENAKPTTLQLPSAPISIVDGSLARNYSHVHAMLVISTFFARFQSLVEDTSTTLLNNLAVVGILQLVYVVVCLPPTANSPSSSANTTSRAPAKQLRLGKSKATKASKGESGAAGRTVPALLSHLLTVVLATPFFTLVLVLFGAPIIDKIELTALCAAHMGTLAIMPLVYVHGVDQHRWWEVAGLMSPSDEVFGAAIGTMVGAWLGAVPIPLDWDRDWQKWPITIVSGAYCGWAVGKVVGGSLLRGKKLDLTG